MFDYIKSFFKKPIPVTSDEPSTFEEAVSYLAARLDKHTCSKSHPYHSCGMSSIRKWLIDKHSQLYKHMQTRYGICHPDDTGAIISMAAHALKNNKPYDPEADVLKFKQYWLLLGYDPQTMQKLDQQP